MSIKKTDMREISAGFGEPDFFRNFREEAGREAEHLPKKTLHYGLGIFEKIEDEEMIRFDVDSVRYEFGAPRGVRVLSWKDGMKDAEALRLLEKHFSPDASPVLKNFYFASSLARFKTGIVVIAEEDGAVLEFSSIAQKSGADFVFVVAKKGTSIRILETVRSDGSYFFGRTIFVVAEEGGKAEYVSVQGVTEGCLLFQNKFSCAEAGDGVDWYDIHAGNGFVKSDVELFLPEEGSRASIASVVLSANEHVDIYNAAHHLADHSSSRIFARGVVGSHGKIIYRGLANVGKGRIGVSAKQEARFVTVAPDAEVDAIPALEVASSGASSSHSVSVTHVKDTDLFFSAVRGIPSYRAQAMWLSGFLAHSLHRLPEVLQKSVGEFINKKLSSPLFRVDD